MTCFLEMDEVFKEKGSLLNIFQRESRVMAGRMKLHCDYFSLSFSLINLVSTSSELYPYKIREGERQAKFLRQTFALDCLAYGELSTGASSEEIAEIFVYLSEIEEHYVPVVKEVIEIYLKTKYRICFVYCNFLNSEDPAFLETLPDNIRV